MKLNGKTIAGPRTDTVVIPREGEPLVFNIQAVLDYEDFNNLCPMPKPPVVTEKGGKQRLDSTDDNFVKELNVYARQHTNWTMIKSLSVTKGLEFDLVKINEPETWLLFEKELREAGLSDGEVNYLVGKIIDINALNEKMLEEAKSRFFATQKEKEADEATPKVELPNT